MEKLKTYMKQDNKGLICSAITVVGALLGLVMYIITTGNTNGEVSVLLVITSVAAVVLAVSSCFMQRESYRFFPHPCPYTVC